MINRKEFLIGSFFMSMQPLLTVKENRSNKRSFFKHGVASGDPLQDRVIIWTRVSPNGESDDIVHWAVAQDQLFQQVLQTGKCFISPDQDFTVKVDVKELQPGTKYFYRFRYKDEFSIIGATQTLPLALNEGSFNIAVMSCNRWEHGYFNAFRFLAQKEEVDMVLHLGDYIYEYGANGVDDSIGRIPDPQHELVTLEDYRRRYAQYHTDPDLQLLHASKPFYMVWDDHEFANDSYVDGAQNHQPAKEGKWSERKKVAMQAYFEWLPIRATFPQDLQRKITIGKELDIFLLDQRMSGRTKQLSVDDSDFNNEVRTILGQDQYSLLVNNLKNSKARWKLIANQVIISGYKPAPDELPTYKDKWLGYPHERNNLINFLQDKKIQNTIFLTGDHHRSFVLALHAEKELMNYTKSYSERPLAWELLTPSINSQNDDKLSAEEIREKEKAIYSDKLNPHLVYADIKNHGYYIAKVNKEKFQAEYFFVNNLHSRIASEQKAASFEIKADDFLLKQIS